MKRTREKAAWKRTVTAPRRQLLRPLLWGTLGAALAIGGALLGRSVLHHPAETGADMEPISPAERAVREAARSRPAEPEAQDKLGAYLLEQRRPYEAMWAFQNALDLRPGEGEACRGLARALVMARLPRQALEALTHCSAAASPVQDPKSEEIENRRVAAAAYLAQGDPIGAVAVLSAARASLDASAAGLLDLGNAEEALGDGEAALAVYQRLAQVQPDSVEGELGLGRVATQQRRWTVAAPALERARRAAPDDPRPLYQAGVMLLSRGESEGARSAAGWFRRVIQLHPDYGPAYLQLGLWYLQHGQPGAAAVLLEKAVTLGTGGEATRRQLAAALAAAGQKAAATYQRGLFEEAVQRPDRALVEYQRLAVLDPGRKDIPLLLSAVYDHLDRKDQALEVARQGLARHPDDPQLLARCAMLLIMTDNRAAASDLCRRWIERDPQAAEPYLLRARLEREALRSTEAIRFSERATLLEPRRADFGLEAGLALAGAPTPSNLRRAAAVLRRTIALDPRASEPHLRLGEVLEWLGDREGACLQYQRGMDRDPATRRGVYSLSQLCPHLGKAARSRFYALIVPVLSERSDALQTLSRQLSRTPDDLDARARLARLLLEMGELQQARCQLEQVVALRPNRKKERRELEMLQRLLALQEQ